MEHRVSHKMPHTMLLHGLGQNSDSWKQVIDCLPTEQKELLHTPDLFALSEEISYEGLYRGWEQSCQKLPGRLHLCGLSLGAVLALDYTIRHPQRVESLVLIAGQYRSPKFLLSVQSLLFSLMPASNFAQLGISKEQMLRLLPNARKREIAGAAHEVNLQAPQQLAKELSAFWESLPKSSDL